MNVHAKIAPDTPRSGDQDILVKEAVQSEPVSKTAQELVNLLLIQIEQVRAHLQGIVIGEKTAMLAGLQQAGEELDRLVNTTKTVGFKGLGKICKHIGRNIQLFLAQIGLFQAEQLKLLLDWLVQAQAYLSAFNDSNAAQNIVAGLDNKLWALPLPSEELAIIVQQIQSEGSSVGDQSESSRIEVATDADVSLALPSDVNQELLELLLQELPVYTQQFSEAVQRLQLSGSEQDVEVAQRIAHTLKGSANTVGVKGIAALTHHLEDILIACSRAQKLPGPALANSLINASDCLESMSEALLGFSAPPRDAKAVLQDILDWANRFDKGELPDRESDAMLTDGKSITGEEEGSEQAAHAPLQPTMVRVAADKIENLFRLSGESIILNSQAQESIRRMKKQLQDMHLQFGLLKQLGSELEQLIDVKNLMGRTVAITSPDFDALEMDQYNELHTASRRMAEAAVDAREIGLDISTEMDKINEVMEQQQQLVIEAQEVAMQTRLVPVSSIAPRLQRCLRQTCRLTGKQSELVFTGENLLIDGDTLNALIDPLLHILRNAIDHGIENEQDRIASNKPKKGQINIEFGREGNTLLVRCQDDGRGLDFEAIRTAAEKRGIIEPGEAISETELQRFILRPNFSTRDVTTQTSGRGVGIGAVFSQIKAMGGSLTMESEPNLGMTIELSIPLPLSLTYVLLVNVGQHRVTIANKGIIQIHYSGEMELITANNQEKLLIDGKTYSLVKLDKLLRFQRQPKHDGHYGAILLVQNEDKTTAVLVDSIVDTRDVVIKSMGSYLGKIPGYIGATIFGDGSVKPVIDLPELLRATSRTINSLYLESEDIVEPEIKLPTVLVVDDSLSQRRALEQLLTDAGYKVCTARDGIEAIELLPQVKPDLVLTDLEMPRMNGIELTAHIRAQFNETRLPVIMATSRTTLKHRQLAEKAGIDFYFTKPVRDEELLMKMQLLMEGTTRDQPEIV
jgi:chemotaxis protein histidine kinase CheA/ActR/RegA family two-component response regulator